MNRREREREVTELRAVVEVLAGAATGSRDLAYLRRRVNELLTEHRMDKDTAVAATVSPLVETLGVNRYAMVRRLATGDLSVGAVVRRAVDEYAVRHGHGADVEHNKRKVNPRG